jgi:hypothetical protein
VWNVFFQLFGVIWAMPQKVSDILESRRDQLGNRHALRMWRLIPLCVMWFLLQEWNARSFEDKESGMIELRKLPLNTLFSWSGTWLNSHDSTFYDFIELCLFLVNRGSLYTSCIHGLRPYARFDNTIITCQKKKFHTIFFL